MIYLDWAASAPPEPEALAAAAATATRFYANPSSPHAAGREAANELSRLRVRMASLLAIEPEEIVFTSGATESDAAALLSVAVRARPRDGRTTTIVIGGLEHAAIHEQARLLEQWGVACRIVAAGADGRVTAEAVAAALDRETMLVSVMLVNNETGVVQPVAEIAAAAHAHAAQAGRRILVHTDAAQALGKLPFRPRELGVDAASLSAHKIGGPRGVGALFVRAGSGFVPGLVGGGQERGMRPGTENLPGIAGFVAAAEARLASLDADVGRARDLARRLTLGVLDIQGARLFPHTRAGGEGAGFSPWIVLFGFPPLPGEVVVRLASEQGICIATGSACSSQKRIHTRVLEAMGLDRPTALSAVRVSLGPSTTETEIDGLLSFLRDQVPARLATARGRTVARPRGGTLAHPRGGTLARPRNRSATAADRS